MHTQSKVKELFDVVEGIVKKYHLSYMDAILFHCEENGIEVETIAKYIRNNEKMKSQLEKEAEDLNFLPKQARLF